MFVVNLECFSWHVVIVKISILICFCLFNPCVSLLCLKGCAVSCSHVRSLLDCKEVSTHATNSSYSSSACSVAHAPVCTSTPTTKACSVAHAPICTSTPTSQAIMHQICCTYLHLDTYNHSSYVPHLLQNIPCINTSTMASRWDVNAGEIETHGHQAFPFVQLAAEGPAAATEAAQEAGAAVQEAAGKPWPVILKI